MTEPLLQIRDVVVEYPSKGFRTKPFRALKGVSLDIRPGECVGLVGESGSGKTTLGRAVLGLAPVTGGSIRFDGRELTAMSSRERRGMGSDIQVVFQDPYTSLNPSMTIGDILAEPLTARDVGRKAAQARVAELLEQVRLPTDSVRRLPREFSGGQRQRVAIARALALDPRLIICDEPVSALDLSTQARVLDLFVEIQERTGVAYLFVTHDLEVVRHVSHRVAVMYQGEIVERGETADVTSAPEHPYTQRLWMASPVPDPVAQERRRAERQRLLAVQAEQDQQAGAVA
ncbi:peptide/nickel transport system ATP-binding protein [Sanguibacter gelidistatuariae]|uniref:Peptide/nickel transport system ATP-binding protein n=1 Tax=Sanguibacter gelidistatuariae TaxID=1814289 RepID=A0A1G6UXK4_9MICO|nr:ATP-binding cassette domain-containing protein [Sanguibacter gelidistatuariae]SDD45387.1 peptide/nickel transport system ATP-binding protein [Sanguibacter gelidistatuariae]